jgi:hypothetical protein
MGVVQTKLVPPPDLVARFNGPGAGQTVSADDLELANSAYVITPTLHLGGSGYFFKLDVPVSYNSSLTTVGIGIYPVNIGIFVDCLDILPYLSLGGAASVVRSRATANPGTSDKVIGATAQARTALGVKYFPLRGSAISIEVGYSPWAIGIVSLPGLNGETHMRGGVGSMTDVSVGLEWL